MNPLNPGLIVGHDLTIVSLIMNASVVVQAVMALLVLASLLSWSYIFLKIFAPPRAPPGRRIRGRVLERRRPRRRCTSARPAGATRAAGSSASSRPASASSPSSRQPGIDSSALLDGTRRAMRATYQREMDVLEAHLSFLATVGSVSPYIGLFGTVWGIMNAFRGLANVAQATLAQVAPGIAEALVATAMGLFAAIPAVIAYNRFSHDVDRLASRYETFMEELPNILQRQAHLPDRDMAATGAHRVK